MSEAKNNVREVHCADDVRVGDVLLRRKYTVMHVGICIEANQILHNIPGEGEHCTDFATFAKDKTVYAISSGMSAEEVKLRAQELLASPQDYKLFQQNCEHTVNKILNGKAVSKQLEEVEAWALIGAALGRSFGRKAMYVGGVVGAFAGLLSLPRMWWLK